MRCAVPREVHWRGPRSSECSKPGRGDVRARRARLGEDDPRMLRPYWTCRLYNGPQGCGWHDCLSDEECLVGQSRTWALGERPYPNPSPKPGGRGEGVGAVCG